MKDKLRELAERWKGRSSKFTPEGDLAFAYSRCADELLAILDAEVAKRLEAAERDAKRLAALEQAKDAVCTNCFGRGQKCLPGCSAHDDNWYACEVCKGSGKVLTTERQQPIRNAEDDDGAVPFGWVNFIGELSVTKKNSDDTPVFTHPAPYGVVSDEDVASAMQAYIDESGIEDTRGEDYLPIDDEAMLAALRSFVVRNRK